MKTVKAGIPGFDELVQGGFPEGSSILIGGEPGAGKTIFALQFLYNGAKLYNENGLYVTIEERPADLREQAGRLGMNLEKFEKDGKLKILKVPVDIAEIDIIEMIRKEAKKIKPKRIVIDSISILEQNAAMYEMLIKSKKQEDLIFSQIEAVRTLPTNTRNKQFIYVFMSRIKDIDATILFIGDSPRSIGQAGEFYTRDTISEFVCDGLVMLYAIGLGGQSDRTLCVHKMRSIDHVRGPVPMEITGNGIVVDKKRNSYGFTDDYEDEVNKERKGKEKKIKRTKRSKTIKKRKR